MKRVSALFWCCFFVSIVLAVPRPKAEPPRIIGAWAIQWGAFCHQVTTFRMDGTCESPEFGKGTWREEGGSIFFGERDDTMQYVMAFDEAGDGKGAWIMDDGKIGGAVDVKAKRKVD